MNEKQAFSTERLERQVSEYCVRYGIAPVFPISPLWNIEDGYQGNLQFPYTGATGCYAIYSQDGKLLYIGKASLNHTLGGRLDSYFMGVRSSAPGAPKGNWNSPPKYIQTVQVNEPFEAPSLEEYLILKLQPCENARKGRSPPQSN
jgi:GIY-YIG catalytic domain